MKVALVTDWMDTFGGGERCLMQLHAMFPDAPVFTTVHDPAKVPPEMRGWDVRTSFIQRIPLVRSRHLAFFPLMPLAFERFELSGFDVVVSTSSACAKGVIPPPGAAHLCYCYTPCRYLWDLHHEYTRRLPAPARAAASLVAHPMRVWDRVSSDRVDHFVAISHEVARRIRRHYGRDSEVIYPPVEVERFRVRPEGPDDFYLVVSRLVGYKRIDLAVRAATKLGRRLLVVGDGPERKRLKAIAGPTVEFLGRRSDAEIADLYARCRAFLFPGLEDFGITPLEAQAAGRPVIAFAAGGALETVVDGVTGTFFDRQEAEALEGAIVEHERGRWDPAACRANAERFEPGVFRGRIRAAVERELRRARDAASAPQLRAEPRGEDDAARMAGD